MLGRPSTPLSLLVPSAKRRRGPEAPPPFDCVVVYDAVSGAEIDELGIERGQLDDVVRDLTTAH